MTQKVIPKQLQCSFSELDRTLEEAKMVTLEDFNGIRQYAIRAIPS